MKEAVIPFNKPSTVGRELDYIQTALRNGHTGGDGPFTRQCQTLLETLLDAPKVLLTTSCTHALEMAAILLNIKEGDEIITPSFTFVSTANAFAMRGAKPVFVDIRPDTLNINEKLIEAKITNRTKAIVVVHYAGVGCEMDTIMEIANRHNIPVVEDNAHGLFGTYKGKQLGTFGVLGTLSFHETKNFSCGEGGALIINDQSLIERAEIIREKGTDRSQFFRGEIDKYTWTDVGSSYVLSDMLAGFLYGQLEEREYINTSRRAVWEIYNNLLSESNMDCCVSLPHVPYECEHPGHLFYILLNGLSERTAMIAHLKQHGIFSMFHYIPLHSSRMGQKYGAKHGDCPVTEMVSDRLLRLPLYCELSTGEQQRVVSAINNFRFECAACKDIKAA